MFFARCIHVKVTGSLQGKFPCSDVDLSTHSWLQTFPLVIGCLLYSSLSLQPFAPQVYMARFFSFI